MGNMAKIRRDDEVVVLAGRDRGRRGKVVKILPDGRLIVSGIHMVKRHTKPNPAINNPGGIVDKEAPIQSSNVAIFNVETGKGDRVGFIVKDGVKSRVYKSDGRIISATQK